MSPEDKAELQAMMLDAVAKITTGVTTSLERYLRDRVVEIQVDVDSALDQVTAFGIDLKEIRANVARLSRERFRDLRRDENEQQYAISTRGEIETLKYQIGKLTERLDSLDKGS